MFNDILTFETPRIRQFYEQHLSTLYDTPSTQKIRVKLFPSPHSSQQRKQLDLFQELLLQDSEHKKLNQSPHPFFL